MVLLVRAALDPSKAPYSASPNSFIDFVIGNVEKIPKVDVIVYSKQAAKILCLWYRFGGLFFAQNIVS